MDRTLGTKRTDLEKHLAKLRELEAKKKADNSELDTLARKQKALEDQVQNKQEEQKELQTAQSRFDKHVREYQ